MNNSLNHRQAAAAKSNVVRHYDRFDMEAEREANAISRRNGMTPRKLGANRSGFGRPVHHPNAAANGAAY